MRRIEPKPGPALLERRTVLVVGGTGAIGGAVESGVAELGFHTVTLSRRTRPPRGSRPVEHVACDITDDRAVRRSLGTIVKRWGSPWAVVNCAGCNLLRPADRYSVSEIRRILEVNLYGAMLVARFVIPFMKRVGRGKIINIASQAGVEAEANNTVYSAAKAGLVGFGHGLARELAPFGISVVSVCPGEVESPMMNRAMRDLSVQRGGSARTVRRALHQDIPLGRFSTPAEIGRLVALLVQLDTPCLTGSAIVVAGGKTCH